jgi:hypothetical protein
MKTKTAGTAFAVPAVSVNRQFLTSELLFTAIVIFFSRFWIRI